MRQEWWRTLNRWWHAHPRVSDWVLVAIVVCPPRAYEHPGWRPLPVQIAVWAALALPLLWRRSHPRLAAPVVAAAALVQLLGHVWGNEFQRGAIALVAIIYTFVVHGRRREATVVTAYLIGLAMWWALRPGGSGLVETKWAGALMLALAWVYGEYTRARRAHLDDVEQRAVLAESRRDALARAAVAEERARIAREIHDILAHSVSVMVLQAEGAKVAHVHDPSVVDRSLLTIADTGRTALADLRLLLEVLHSDDLAADGRPDDPARAPQPTTPDLVALVARCAAGRAPIELATRGDASTLPPTAALQVHRIVQEALTNVVKHAAPDARARVDIDFGRTARQRTVAIEVHNEPGHAAPNGLPSSGRGLAGMRERAAIFGGAVHAGPDPDGGYRVAATLHVGSPAPLPSGAAG
ncbi:sensor histidine kinase [Embleya sp. AB8]|uniref:sensor histidine kinase n=1 Tax=Embleya sp. AB8 TaxID=3156304 RepID=UPI003C73B5C9